MAKKVKMVFVTQNTAPFRMQWLDELAGFIDITVYHLGEYDSTMNSKYISYVPRNIKIKEEFRSIGKHRFFKPKKIIAEKADIILLDGYGFIGQIAMIAYLRLRNIAFYMSLDGGFIPTKESSFKKAIKRFCLNGANGFFSTAEMTDNFIKHYLKKPKPIYRHFFSSLYSSDICRVDKARKAKYKQKLGLENKFTVISVGRFIPVKGFDILLKAAAKAEDGICFVFVGGKPTEEYNRLVSDINPESTRFVDFLNKESLKEYYCAADVFAIPSRGDVWGLVVGEAMAYGLPILSSCNCIAAVSMVKNGENGFIRIDEDPESYLSKIAELKTNPGLIKTISENNYLLIRKYAMDISVINDIKNIASILNVKITEDGFDE